MLSNQKKKFLEFQKKLVVLRKKLVFFSLVVWMVRVVQIGKWISVTFLARNRRGGGRRIYPSRIYLSGTGISYTSPSPYTELVKERGMLSLFASPTLPLLVHDLRGNIMNSGPRRRGTGIIMSSG